MKTLNAPKLVPVHTGEQLKVLEITALAGAEMPLHHATSDAVVVVLEGEAKLQISDEVIVLSKGMSFLIPNRKEHALQVTQDFKAKAIMLNEASIEFN